MTLHSNRLIFLSIHLLKKKADLSGAHGYLTRYQVFALFSSGYLQEYEKEKREVFKDCWIFRIKRDLKGEIVRYKACKIVKSYPHKYGDNHHFGMGVT